MHGGTATGPRTVEGRKRIAKARTITGLHGAEARELRQAVAELRRLTKAEPDIE